MSRYRTTLVPAHPDRRRRRLRHSRAPGRLVAAGLTALMATASVAFLGSPADAALSRVGPVDATTGFPAWYADSNGVSLQLCLDGVPNCLASFDDLVTAHNDGGDGEAFYYAADATVGGITVHNALEAAYAGPGAGQEMVFMRTQVSAKGAGLKAGAKYTVTDPYGRLTSCTADSNGNIVNNACRTETVPAALDFAGALGGRVGPFLTWDTYGAATGAPPAGYIGDNATPHKVVGSPTGFNAVRIEGPGINTRGNAPCGLDWTGPAADCAETDLFVVQGKVQPSASRVLTPGSLDFGNTATATTRSLTYTSTGSEPVTGLTVTQSGSSDFGLTENCSTDPLGVAPRSSCTIDVTYTPSAATTATGSITVSDSVGSKVIPLSGRSQGVITSDLPSIAFPNQKVATTSATETVVIGNDGVAPLAVGTPTLTGTGASHYKIAGNGCTAPLAPTDGCEIAVAFAPTSTGLKSAKLNVPSNGGTAVVDLSGRGTQPVVTLSTSSITFPDQAVGTTSPNRSVTVTNGGSASLFIDDVTLEGTDLSQFRITGGNCTPGTNLAVGLSCNVLTASAPTSTGAKSASLVITADGAPKTVALAGRGVATPSAPAIGAATGGDGAASVSWTAPADAGGSAITGYEVQALSGTTVAGSVTLTDPTVRSATISGLVNGTSYTLRVRATNGLGAGAWSDASNAVTPAAPATAPGAPTIGTATAGDAQAVVRWTPGSTGGSPITSYEVQVFTGTALVRTVTGLPAGATSATVTGLTNGTAYTFRVRAVNAVGAGTPSAASNTVTPVAAPVATVPGAPVIGTATAGAAGGAITATANWTPPTSTGGSPITGYVVRALRMSATGTVLSTTTSAVQPAAARRLQMTLPVTGNYRFTVAAVNAVGAGAQSARSNLVAGR